MERNMLPKNIHIKLETFEGPFDLLFRLIEKNEIDIYDIPMAKLVRQYLEAIRNFPPDMENMSEFLVMAATLLEVKSRMLLPRFKAEGNEEEDPREALVQQLIAYKYCQGLAEALKELGSIGRRLFKSPEYPLMKAEFSLNPGDWLENITTENLLQIFNDVIKRQALKADTIRQNFGTVARENYTIEEKILKIESCLKGRRYVFLSDLFLECKSREECIVTFLALLELIKANRASVMQKDVFGEIEVSCPT